LRWGREDTALRGAFIRRGVLSLVDHPGFQPVPDHSPGGERPDQAEQVLVVDSVEGIPDTLRASMS